MRILFCLLTVILISGNSLLKAQYYDQSMGIRAGTSFEATYKRFIFFRPDIQQAVECMAGFQIDENVVMLPYDIPINNGFVTEGLWLFHIDLGFETNFSGYVGAGLYLGLYVQTGLDAPFFGGGGTVAVGVEYTFTHVPLSVTIDWKPIFGYPRFSLARGALTLRYLIPTTWH